jgi:protoporphyrinogen oxidase
MRKRLTRIFFLRKFFEYPLSLNFSTLLKLGLIRTARISASYIRSRIKPIRPEKSLEDFFINRFGKELYLTFFKDYTEKVWGIPCNSISPQWGAQRVKSLSISRLILHAIKQPFSKNSDIDQKNTETSLIHQFMFPKLGAGQFWETVADIIKEKGGEIKHRHEIVGIEGSAGRISGVHVKDLDSGQSFITKGDYFFSSMPVRELIRSFKDGVPDGVKKVADGLQYRDSIVVGLLLKRLKIKNNTKIKTVNNIIPDNWLYIQERDAKAGRLQIFNNFSPYMVKDLNNVSIGLEYFCSEADEMSSKPDQELIRFAIEEMIKLNFIDRDDVIDNCLIRIPKAYPVYFGSYDEFDIIRDFTDKFENLFLIGRNGMHRYNNMDHSMLSAMTAVENIINGIKDKDNIWQVNTEKTYSEEKPS